MKQVSFLTKILRQMAIGIKVFGLSGGMSQNVRREQYESFCGARSALMIATDVAARGLDFPRIDLVFQLDLPISTAVYIHRIGRTARNHAHGRSISLVMPQEKEFLDMLHKANIDDVKEMSLNPRHMVSIKDQLSAILSHDSKLKYLAMKYFESYVKHLSKGLSAVKLNALELPLEEFAQRLGLAEKPNVQMQSRDMIGKEEDRAKKAKSFMFDALNNIGDGDELDDGDDLNEDDVETETDTTLLSKLAKKSKKSKTKDDGDSDDGNSDGDSDSNSDSDSDSDDSDDSDSDDDDDSELDIEGELESIQDALEEDEKSKKKRRTKVERFIERAKPAVFSQNNYKLIDMGDDNDEDGDFFQVKRLNHELTKEEEEEIKYSVRANKKKLLKNEAYAKHTLFTKDKETDQLKPISKFEALVKELKQQNAQELAEEKSKYAKEISEQLKSAEVEDKLTQKNILREKRKKQREEEQEMERMRKAIEDIESGRHKETIDKSMAGQVSLGGADDGDHEQVEIEVDNNPYKQMLDEYGGGGSDGVESDDDDSDDGDDDGKDAQFEEVFKKQLKKTVSNTKKQRELRQQQEEKLKEIEAKKKQAKRSFDDLMKSTTREVKSNNAKKTDVSANVQPSAKKQKKVAPVKATSDEDLALQLLDGML